MEAISIVIPGEAVPQGRPRVTHCGTYDPPKSKEYKRLVGIMARSAMRGRKPFTGPTDVQIYIYKEPPKSWSKTKKEHALHGQLLPTARPDVDNYAKGIMDGMKGICWQDDAQVITLRVGKRYGQQAHAEVIVTEV